MGEFKRKNIGTSDLFCKYIEDKYERRVKDISYYSTAIDRTKTQNTKEVLHKNFVLILYANLEGFVQEVAKAFLHHVKLSGLSSEHASTSLILFNLLGSRVSDISVPSKVIDIIDKFLNKTLVKIDNLSPDSIINTKSNLSYEVLIEIYTHCGIPKNKVKSKEFEINSLLGIRNKLAHGEYFYPYDPKIVDELHKATLELLKVVKDDFQEESRALKSTLTNSN